MDVVSHWFWGVLATRKHVNWKVAGPMAVLPDLLAFVPSLIYSIANGLERPTVDDTTVTSDFPAIAWEMYQYTHSAVMVTALPSSCRGSCSPASKAHASSLNSPSSIAPSR